MLPLLLVTMLGAGPVIHVAPTGNDQADGSAARPLATPAAAQAKARALRLQQPNLKEPLTIEFAAGTYVLAEPLIFGGADSGRADSPTVYTAAKDARVIFSGGVKLTGWRVTGGRWLLALPEVKAGDWRFCQLWVNGERRQRPRWPQEGYSYVAGAAPKVGEPNVQGQNRFRYDRGDLNPQWHNLQDVEVLAFHNWSMSRIPVAQVDDEKRLVTLAGHTWHDTIGSLDAGRRYLCENVLEALNEPGQWYLDCQTGVLTYLPRPGEAPDTTEVIAPRLERLVSFQGDAKLGTLVEHITLRGLSFQHTTAKLPPTGYSVAQAEVGAKSTNGRSPFRSAIDATAAQHVSIEGCEIAHVGYYAVEFGAGCHDNAVRDCEMWDLGGGGAKLGTEDMYPEGDPRTATGTTVQDCLIAHGGRLHPAAVGVWIGHSSDNQIDHNDIYDLYYSGVSVGWRWGWGYSPAKRNLIEDNRIWDIGQHRLSDLGGIYTLGESDGTVLRHNLIHDISRVEYGGSGVYHDQASMGIVVENNLVYRTQDAGYVVHWAKECVTRNNIFALCEEYEVGPGRVDLSGPLTFQHNLVYYTRGTLTRRGAVREDADYDYNLYWPGEGREIVVANNLTFAQWQATGKDGHSLVADPQFVDPEGGDFHLKPGSPATKVGFEPFPLEGWGRRTPTRTANQPPVPHTYADAAHRPPRPFDEDFELYEVGDTPVGMRLYQNNDRQTVSVTTEQAAGGKRALKVVDGPDPGPSYNPHFFYDPRYDDGRVTSSFDVWLSPPTQLGHEWRNSSGSFKVGPTINIRPGGKLYTRDRELMTLPTEQWVHLALSGSLGEATTGKFTVTVRLADGQTKTFDDLPCDPDCRSIHWLGWIAAGSQDAVFYLDNLQVGPQK